MINTSESQLKAGFWKVHRHKDNRYYFNLHQIINRTIFVDEIPSKCKYCKAYPFEQSLQVQTKDKSCQLCGSINQTPIKLENPHHFVNYQWYSDHSYIFPLKNKQTLKSLIILALDPQLDSASFQMFYQGLSISLSQESNQQYAVVILLGPTLGVLNLNNEDQPQMINLSQQVSAREIIQHNKFLLQSRHITQLKTVIQVIKSQKKPNNKGYPSLWSLFSKYQEFDYNSFTMFLLISPAPQFFAPFPSSSLYLIAFFISEPNFKYSDYIELKNAFHQVYIISGQDKLTKFYYKIYEILAFSAHTFIHRKSPIIRTNHLYSGTIQTQSHSLISSRSPFMQVSTANDNPHCLQIQLQYFDQQHKQWFMLVANFKDLGAYRSQAFQKCILAWKTLQFLINKHIQAAKPQKQSSQFDYSFIRQGIEQYKEKFQNATSYMQSLLHHMHDYFKENQKEPEKLIAPFEYMGTISLLPVFWPILLGNRILYYSHGYYQLKTQEKQNQEYDEVQRVHQLLQRFYTGENKKFDYFYRICLDNRTLVVLQKTD